MKPELQILFIDVASTETVCKAIARRSSNLEGTVDTTPGCHVSVEQPADANCGLASFRVRVHATAIDGQAVIGQGEHPDCHLAVDSAFDIVQWQLAERAALVWSAGPWLTTQSHPTVTAAVGY